MRQIYLDESGISANDKIAVVAGIIINPDDHYMIVADYIHKAAVAMFLGIYNFVRKHKTLGMTPAVAAAVEIEAWDLERVVEMTADYMRRKEDAKFEEAFAGL